jgi:hypothetical protein
MKKKILVVVAILGLSTAGLAQANLSINNSHMTADTNSIETYFITSNFTGASDISLSSIDNTFAPMNGLLSVWKQVGSNWELIGANNDAPFTPTAANNDLNPPQNVYGSTVHQWSASDPLGGISDPGLSVGLTAGTNYLVIQSDFQNGPTSLDPLTLAGSVGQTIALGSNLQSALWGQYLPGVPTGVFFNNYTLTITGDVTPSAVPLPAAVWLFGSVLAGLGLVGRKNNNRYQAF